MKQIKCKKCGMKYDNNKKECPYCHKKRFNPTGLIILIILLLILGGGTALYFMGYITIPTSISNLFVKKQSEMDGIKFAELETKQENNKIGITFEAENTNSYDVQLNYELTTYVDDYLTGNYNDYNDYFSWTNIENNVTETIVAKKKCKYTFYIEVPESWTNIEIFCRRNENWHNPNNNTIETDKNNQNVLVMTIQNNEQ